MQQENPSHVENRWRWMLRNMEFNAAAKIIATVAIIITVTAIITIIIGRGLRRQYVDGRKFEGECRKIRLIALQRGG